MTYLEVNPFDLKILWNCCYCHALFIYRLCFWIFEQKFFLFFLVFGLNIGKVLLEGHHWMKVLSLHHQSLLILVVMIREVVCESVILNYWFIIG